LTESSMILLTISESLTSQNSIADLSKLSSLLLGEDKN